MPYDCQESEDDFATRSANETEAKAENEILRRKLENRLNTIKSARNYITTGFGELRRELSLLPNQAPDFAPENAVEWHAALVMLENVLAVAASAWQTADHHLGVTLHNLATDTEAINS